MNPPSFILKLDCSILVPRIVCILYFRHQCKETSSRLSREHRYVLARSYRQSRQYSAVWIVYTKYYMYEYRTAELHVRRLTRFSTAWEYDGMCCKFAINLHHSFSLNAPIVGFLLWPATVVTATAEIGLSKFPTSYCFVACECFC